MAKRKYDFEIDKIPMEAIPEAIVYKRTVLELLNTALLRQSEFYSVLSQKWGKYAGARFLNYQATVISLYSYLKPKLTESELEKFKRLDEFRQTVVDKRERLKGMGGLMETHYNQLPISYLNECLDVLNRAIERIGITKIEKKMFDEKSAMA